MYKNVKFVFGLPSSLTSNLLNYIPNEIKWVNVGIELQSGFVAQVYGKYINDVGILMIGTGPAMATAFSCIKNAECETKPLLVITTYETIRQENFQYWDIEKISKSIIKYV